MKIASKMMIGSGMPINQSNNPRPNPIARPPAFLFVRYLTAGSGLCSGHGTRALRLLVRARVNKNDDVRCSGTAVTTE
jgi:hypothetical protein